MTLTLTEPALPAATATPAIEGGATPRWRRPAPVALGLLAFLLSVAWSNRVFLWAGTLRSALLLVVLGPGLVALGVLVVRRDPAAVAAGAFLAIATASTLASREPLMSLFGDYFARTGLLFLVAGLGLWALGRVAAASAAPVLGAAILAGAVVNAAIAWLQMSTELGIRGLEPVDGRASGLLGNPVFLSGLCAGAVWLALAWARRAPRPLVPLLLVAFLVGAVQLSGGRSGLLAVLVGGAWFVVGYVRAQRWARAAGVIAALVLGVLVALVPAGSAASAAARANRDGTGGMGPRIAVWDAGVRSLAEDPLLGVGPGRFSEAASPRRGLVSVRYEGRDVLLGDAHNVVVQVLTTTGVLGLLAFGTWLGLSGRRARGPLAGFAALVGLTMLLEPLDLAVTPLVCLALGAATLPGTLPQPSERIRSWVPALGAVLALVGLVAGLRLVAGDASYADAVVHSSPADLRHAEQASPPWPQYPALRSAFRSVRADAAHDARLGRSAIAAQRRAIARDGTDPRWWYGLGVLEERWGTVARARADYHAALARNPWSWFALTHLYGLELRAHHLAAARDARARLCEIGPSECPPPPRVIARWEGSAVTARGARSASTG